MYLSRMPLDLTKQKTMLALTRPDLFHGAIESSFSGVRLRNLWRIDRLAGNRFLLILSPDKPDLSSAVEQFGYSDADLSWETKDYSPLLSRIEKGTVWNFRLTANPTKSCTENQNKGENRGDVKAHVSVRYQESWLTQRADKHGFALAEDAFLVTNSRWFSFRKGSNQKRNITLLSVTYEGVLTVTEPVLFKDMLIHGLGRGKAYGMGLMTLVHWKPSPQ